MSPLSALLPIDRAVRLGSNPPLTDQTQFLVSTSIWHIRPHPGLVGRLHDDRHDLSFVAIRRAAELLRPSLPRPTATSLTLMMAEPCTAAASRVADLAALELMMVARCSAWRRSQALCHIGRK
jgi:hypothetical protein